jgi:hypothetical protein
VAIEAPMLAVDPDASTPRPGADAGRPLVLEATDAPLARGDRYHGHYWCAQGRTELTLVVEDVNDDALEAIFEFDFPGSPAHTAAVGSYRMRGTWDNRARTLHLKGERWIDQPGGYAMVDLTGAISATGTISGRVTGPGCTTFTVTPERGTLDDDRRR